MFLFLFPFLVKSKQHDRYTDHLVTAGQFSSVRAMWCEQGLTVDLHRIYKVQCCSWMTCAEYMTIYLYTTASESTLFPLACWRALLPPSKRICNGCCLSVSNFAQRTSERICMKIFRQGWQWANEQMVKFWWRSGSQIWIRIRIAALVRRALTEVCTVPVLLVLCETLQLRPVLSSW